jgi:hypothetical protein
MMAPFIPLGQVCVQRYRKDDLSVERKKRLDWIEVLFGTGETLFGNGVLQHC